MGLIRAGFKAAKAARSGASGAEIAKEGVKGMLPRRMGGLVDRVATPENMSRIQSGINNVIDSGRAGTFHSSTSSEPDPWALPDYSAPSTPQSSTNMFGEEDPWKI